MKMKTSCCSVVIVTEFSTAVTSWREVSPFFLEYYNNIHRRSQDFCCRGYTLFLSQKLIIFFIHLHQYTGRGYPPKLTTRPRPIKISWKFDFSLSPSGVHLKLTPWLPLWQYLVAARWLAEVYVSRRNRTLDLNLKVRWFKVRSKTDYMAPA